MNPNEPLPPEAPRTGIGKGSTILLWLIAPVALLLFLFFAGGGLIFVIMLWKAITCPHCPFAGM